MWTGLRKELQYPILKNQDFSWLRKYHIQNLNHIFHESTTLAMNAEREHHDDRRAAGTNASKPSASGGEEKS